MLFSVRYLLNGIKKDQYFQRMLIKKPVNNTIKVEIINNDFANIQTNKK